MHPTQIKVRIDPNYILKILTIAVVFLIAMGAVAAYLLTFTSHKLALGIVPSFNLDAEGTLATYLSSLNLGIAALLLWLISQDRKVLDDKYWRHWLGLSVCFAFMAIDETAGLHELIVFLFKDRLHIAGPIHYGISILGFSIVALFLITYSKFILSLPIASRKQFLLSGIVYVLGAFGLEIAGGYFFSHHSQFGSGYYNFEVVVEESLEMIGILLFIKALFVYIQQTLAADESVFKSLPERKKREYVVRRKVSRVSSPYRAPAMLRYYHVR